MQFFSYFLLVKWGQINDSSSSIVHYADVGWKLHTWFISYKDNYLEGSVEQPHRRNHFLSDDLKDQSDYNHCDAGCSDSLRYCCEEGCLRSRRKLGRHIVSYLLLGLICEEVAIFVIKEKLLRLNKLNHQLIDLKRRDLKWVSEL